MITVRLQSRSLPRRINAPAEDAPPEDDLSAKVQQLASLHSQGLLTDDEFTAAKAKALGI